MKLCELPRLKQALDLMGVDNGADAIGEAVIPAAWEMNARLAEVELLQLSADEVKTLAQGEQSEQHVIAKLAPNADRILVAAFDAGELADIFFSPWRSIHDARAAEKRVAAERVAWCTFCKRSHAGGATCMGHYP